MKRINKYRKNQIFLNDDVFIVWIWVDKIPLHRKKKKNIDEKGRHPAQASNKKGLLRSMAIGDIHDRIYTVLPSYTSLSLYEAVKYRYMYVYILQRFYIANEAAMNCSRWPRKKK